MFSIKKILIAVGVFLLVLAGVFVYKAGRTITVIGQQNDSMWEETVSQFPDIPEAEQNREDILLVGIRGVNDGDEGFGNGEYLADTIMIASFNKDNNKAALISIPRDLYVDIPNHGKEKINAAYAVGESRYPGGGLQLMKAVVSIVSGVHVDHAIRVDFEGFQKIVDDMGGITIYRDTPFSESKQWAQDGRDGQRYWKFTDAGWVFYVPAGSNQMNSDEALYYVRSRYSTSDFDRMRRQHQVIEAIKSKALGMGVLSNPVKIFNILDTLGDNVRSDMSISEMTDLVNLIRERNVQTFEKAYLEQNGDTGLLVSDKIDGMYVLLPKSGNYSEIHDMFRMIIQ